MKHGIRPDLVASCDLEVIDTLLPYPGNARLHDDDLLAESLARNGQYRPVLVQTATRRIIAGNGTTNAALSLGWTHVAVQWLDCTDAEALRINVVDNRAGDKGRNDLGDLALQLEQLGDDLAGSGFTDDDLASILAFNAEPLDFEAGEQDNALRSRKTGRAHVECPSCHHVFPTD